MYDPLGLVAHHLDKNLKRGLGAARGTGGRFSGNPPHQEKRYCAQTDGEENRVDVDDRKVDDFGLRVAGGIQATQVVKDVFTGARRVRGGFVSCRHDQFFFQKAKNIACDASTRPISSEGQCRSAYILTTTASNANVSASLSNSPKRKFKE